MKWSRKAVKVTNFIMLNHFGDNSSKQNTHINLRPLFPLRKVGSHTGCRKTKKKGTKACRMISKPISVVGTEDQLHLSSKLVSVIPGKCIPKVNKQALLP